MHVISDLRRKLEVTKTDNNFFNVLQRAFFQKKYEFSQKCEFFKILAVTYWKQYIKYSKKNGVAVICNASLLIYCAPKFSPWYLIKWPVLSLQWSPKNLAPSVLVLNEQTYFFHTLSRNFWLPLALFWETIRESSLAWAWTGIVKVFKNAIENMSNRQNFIVRYYFVLFWTC